MIPDGMRIYAIGDVHGRADLLIRMHGVIANHVSEAPPADNRLVYLGDYVDRGMQVRKVLDVLTTGLPDGVTPVFLKGNHEDMLLKFIANADCLGDWLAMGGRTTLLSYGAPGPAEAPDADRAEEIRRHFLEALPAVHHDFLLNLRLYFQVGGYLFVHAGLRPAVALEKQDPDDLIWIREPFLSDFRASGVRVVHGHSVAYEPEIRPDRIGVDSGAYATGRLSCVVLERESATVFTVQAEGNGDAAI